MSSCYGGYDTAYSYLRTYKGLAEMNGHSLLAPHLRAIADATLSRERGQGGAIKALALPFDRLAEPHGYRAPRSSGGPLSPRNMDVAGSWFLTREVELACARAAMVEFTDSPAGLRVKWHLPASTTDPTAEGVARTHGCSCPPGRAATPCPAHALLDHVAFLKRTFPARVA